MVIEPPLADISDILRVHDADYVHKFVEGRLDDADACDWLSMEPEVERTLTITGATVGATKDVLLKHIRWPVSCRWDAPHFEHTARASAFLRPCSRSSKSNR